MTFFVYGDGKLLRPPGRPVFGQAAQTLSADITGVKIVELVARGASARNKVPTVVTWGNAALLND